MDEFTVLEKLIRQQQTRYWGKYRAFIADNADPQRLGRCRLTVPSVLGDTVSDWALPCFAYGGAHGIGLIAVPPIGAQVVAEFLEGDASSPMWSGAFFRASDELPQEFADNATPSAKVLKTESGHVLLLEDKEGAEGITLRSAAEALLEMDPDGSFALTDSRGATLKLDASAGELRIEDANGNSMVMSSSGIELSDASGNEITTSTGGVTVKGAATVTIEGSSVVVGGVGGEPLIKGSSFMSIFNAHMHNCSGAGAPSGPPITPLSPAMLTTKTIAS